MINSSGFTSGLALLAFAALAGCGGGDTATTAGLPLRDLGGVGSGSLTAGELTQFSSEAARVADGVVNGDLTIALPTTPTARYEGVVSAILDSNTLLAGKANMTGDFVANTMSGTFGDFARFASDQSRVETLSGTIPLTNGTLNPTLKTMTGTMNGTLTGGSGSYAVDGSLLGRFADNGGKNVVSGLLTGTVTGPSAVVDQIDSGTFLVSE